MSDTDTAIQQRQLDAFLVDNQELEALNARLAQFNLLRVLKVEDTEIRHSNVLSWLLSPGESHGLGATFVRRFMSRLLMENEEVEVSLTPAQIELMNFADVEVRREWRNIDIVALSKSDKWCLLIENKIRSKESRGQLVKYRETITRELPGYQVIPVLLTLEGADPSEEGKDVGYVPLAYGQVLELAEGIIEQNKSRIPSDAGVFLTHYLDTPRRLTMQDEAIVDLCKTIYRKHREAIDMIVEYGASSQVLGAVEEQLGSMLDCEYIKSARGSIWFLPKELAVHLPSVELNGWGWLPRPTAIICWINHWKRAGKLGAIMEVGPFVDSERRTQLVKELQQAGCSSGKERALKEGTKFTRVLSEYRKLRVTEDGTVDDDPDYVRNFPKTLWQRFWEDAKKAIPVLKQFDWGRD